MLHYLRFNILEYINLLGRRKGRTFKTESPEYSAVGVLITPPLWAITSDIDKSLVTQ